MILLYHPQWPRVKVKKGLIIHIQYTSSSWKWKDGSKGTWTCRNNFYHYEESSSTKWTVFVKKNLRIIYDESTKKISDHGGLMNIRFRTEEKNQHYIYCIYTRNSSQAKAFDLSDLASDLLLLQWTIKLYSVNPDTNRSLEISTWNLNSFA